MCGKVKRNLKGVFCANFASSRGCWKPCNSVWCGDCYKKHPGDHFHQFRQMDESGFEWCKAGDESRYETARDGDFLMTTFQCDTCVFRNLKNRSPIGNDVKDDLLLCCIRRANLDALWGRETTTVEANLRGVRQMLDLWIKVDVPPTFPNLGPFGVEDTMGYGVAIAMLLKSLEGGRYHGYQQFETIRKLRTSYSNVYMASELGAKSLRSVGRDTSKLFLTNSPTQSLWFERFATGCLRRMGQEVRQDLAISLPVMHAMMDILDREWHVSSNRERSFLASIGAFVLIAFCGSFRGHEVFLVDLHGLFKYSAELQHCGEEGYVIIPLLGRFKGESGSRYHLTPLAAKTQSGLEVKVWIERLLEARQAVARTHGPAFGDGSPRSSNKDYEMAILDRLQQVQNQGDVIPSGVSVYEEYGISRSFRRGATTEARNRGVSEKDVDLMNRWRNVESAKGRKPRLSMQDHYSDIRMLVPALIRFSQAL